MPIKNIENLDNEVKDLKQEKIVVSLPSPCMVKAVIYDLDFTAKGKAAAANDDRPPTIMDGFTLKFAFTDALVGNDKRVLIDYSDLDNIKFPCDITDDKGKKHYCGIQYYETYGLYTLGFNGYNETTDVKSTAIVYDILFGRQFGKRGVLLELLAQQEFGGVTYDMFPEHLEKPKSPVGFPHIYLNRTAGWKYGKDQIDPKTKNTVS